MEARLNYDIILNLMFTLKVIVKSLTFDMFTYKIKLSYLRFVRFNSKQPHKEKRYQHELLWLCKNQ